MRSVRLAVPNGEHGASVERTLLGSVSIEGGMTSRAFGAILERKGGVKEGLIPLSAG